MKLYSNECDFYYPWEQVTAANWRKYPNEVSSHVVAVDVLRREINADQQTLTTERLITCKQSIPSWLQCLIGGKNTSYVREVSVVDLKAKTLVLKSVNLTMSNLLKVYETVSYTPDATDKMKTNFKQEAQITAYAAFQRMCNKIEEWSVERFGENAIKGKAGFDGVLKVLNEQWVRKGELVEEIAGGFDKVVKSVDDSFDKVKVELVKETDKILCEAESVKKSILTDYYDMIKGAFKKD